MTSTASGGLRIPYPIPSSHAPSFSNQHRQLMYLNYTDNFTYLGSMSQAQLSWYWHWSQRLAKDSIAVLHRRPQHPGSSLRGTPWNFGRNRGGVWKKSLSAYKSSNIPETRQDRTKVICKLNASVSDVSIGVVDRLLLVEKTRMMALPGVVQISTIR